MRELLTFVSVLYFSYVFVDIFSTKDWTSWQCGQSIRLVRGDRTKARKFSYLFTGGRILFSVMAPLIIGRMVVSRGIGRGALQPQDSELRRDIASRKFSANLKCKRNWKPEWKEWSVFGLGLILLRPNACWGLRYFQEQPRMAQFIECTRLNGISSLLS